MPKLESCVQCSTPARTYCVDCKKSLCRFCVVLLHHPSTKPEKHSIEEIQTGIHGVQVLSPILLDLLIAGMFLFVLSVGMRDLQNEYYTGATFCPALQNARNLLARLDLNVFYYFKGSLAMMCDTEDSFFRLLIDTFVRGIMTGTDSWLLIISTFPKAYVFQEFIRIVLAPAVAFVYATLIIVVRRAETQMPEWESLKAWKNFAKKISITNRVQAIGKPPPVTHARARPHTDYYEAYLYYWNRIIRRFSFFKAHAQGVLAKLFRCVVWICISVRIFCMLIPAAPHLLRRMALLTSAGTGWMESHETWFKSGTGITGSDVRENYLSDWLLMFGARNVLFGVNHVKTGIGSAGVEVFHGLWTAVRSVLKELLVPMIIFVPPYFLIKMTLKKQRKQFDLNWPSQVQQIWGMPAGILSRDAPMDKWKDLRFHDYAGQVTD